jgi:hypothetical protein
VVVLVGGLNVPAQAHTQGQITEAARRDSHRHVLAGSTHHTTQDNATSKPREELVCLRRGGVGVGGGGARGTYTIHRVKGPTMAAVARKEVFFHVAALAE